MAAANKAGKAALNATQLVARLHSHGKQPLVEQSLAAVAGACVMQGYGIDDVHGVPIL